MQQRVAILLAEGYTDSGLSVILDVLRTANQLAGAEVFRLQLASAQGGEVRAASGVSSASTLTLRGVRNADLVLLPGLWVLDVAAVDVALEREDVRALVRTLGAAHASGAIVGASCSGVFLLAETGALDGARATTTWWLAPHLSRRSPAIEVDAQASLVVDGRCLSAGAVFGVADLALHLVARFLGPNVAHRCAGLLLLHQHPSQAPYMAVHQLGANDAMVRRAEKWARAHLDEEFDVATLAKNVGTSPRTLARRLDAALGMSPIRFVQQLRVETAVHLLHTTRLGIEEISERVGYTDSNSLRRLLRRHAGATPREVRARRRAATAGATGS